MIKELILSTLLSCSIGFFGVTNSQAQLNYDPGNLTTNRSFNNSVATSWDTYKYIPNDLGNVSTNDIEDNDLVLDYKYSYNPSCGQNNVVSNGHISSFNYVVPLADRANIVDNYDDCFITTNKPSTLSINGIDFLMAYCFQLDFGTSLGTDSVGFWVTRGYDSTNDIEYLGWVISTSNSLVTPITKFNNYQILINYQFYSLYYDDFTYPIYSNYQFTPKNFSISNDTWYHFMPFDDTSYDSVVVSFRIINPNVYTVSTLDGYNTGYDDGYAVGKQDGFTLGQNQGNTIGNLFLTIADIPIMMLQKMFNFELFGMPVYNAIFGLITLLAALGVAIFLFTFVIRKVL